MAAGLSLEGERIDEFRRALWRTLERSALPLPGHRIEIDAYLSLDQLSLALVKAMHQLAPFGSGNEQPALATRQLGLVSSAIIGRTREHRRLVVRDAQQREQTVLWWRSADQVVPEGPFDLAYTVGVNTFRGQENVQLTWVAARSLAPPPVEVISKPAIRLQDYRGTIDPEPALRAVTLPADPEHAPRAIVWAEQKGDGSPSLKETNDRTTLQKAGTLIIWTTPPGPVELDNALEIVSPSQVILFGVDPGLDTPRTFLRHLAGLVKHILRKRGGHASLTELAAAMAHREPAIHLGLTWLAQKGQIEFTLGRRNQLSLSQGSGQIGERLHIIQGQLQAQLAETAAYRAYFQQADAKRLIGMEEKD